MPLSNLITRMKTDCEVRGTAHRNRFSYYRKIHIVIGLPSALLATLAGSFATINANDVATAGFSPFEVLSLFITWTVALLTAANSFLNPHQNSLGHRDKATAYDVLLGKIDRVQAFCEGDEFKKRIEDIDKKIEDLKLLEPILSDTNISSTQKSLKKHVDKKIIA